jgi:hypothetical protein
VAAGRPDPSWTTRELVSRAKRSELTPVARDLDRLAYGRAAPGVRDVRALAAALEGMLG